MFSTSQQNLRRAVVAALAVTSLALSGCSSWDTGNAEQESSNSEIISELENSSDKPDPRQLKGVSTVSAFDEVEPVAENPEPALPVELTDNAATLSRWRMSPASSPWTCTARTPRRCAGWA